MNSNRPFKESDRNQEATLYVGSIDEQADETLLYQLMIQAGPVVAVTMPKDRVTLEHSGFAFVEYQYVRDADYAVQVLDKVKLFGKPLRMNKSSQRMQGDELSIGADLFVGNLDALVDEQVLENTFSSFGNLVRKPVISRDENGVSKGHGFVSFDSFEASDRAIEMMDNQYIMNKTCKVEYALKKDGKGERHGDETERLLASQAKKHKVALISQ